MTGEDTVVCIQLNNIIVPFAPTTINMKNMETWRGIEDSSGLCSRTIHSVKFLKPVEFHHEGQQEAHLIIGFDSRIQANKVIQHGIIIKGKELHASKELPDALQCINCSDLPRNHNMKNCPNSTKCVQCAGGPHNQGMHSH